MPGYLNDLAEPVGFSFRLLVFTHGEVGDSLAWQGLCFTDNYLLPRNTGFEEGAYVGRIAIYT